ncbi:hypothetical protein A9Q02_20065 [Candidatus Chloroploca asiatica]|uniref:AAA+ ATPase domain-containing protein n=1 Tax=Candidatus Chloroploca asiatica TaxID=1506545 RepID=A0A2H3KID3_9CHLR|nr:hypothetical protein A9Q02_20065 [Candidatus Chloroploca asiatica]
MLRAIYDKSRPTVLLYGPRRFGKTSFLRNLPKLLPTEVLPIFFSMQEQASLGSVGDFCYGLVRVIIRDAKIQGLRLPATERNDFLRNPYAALQDWLDAALPRLDSRRLLICLDEVEKLGATIAAGKLELSIFDQLRELIQHSDMAFLFCGGVQHFSELGPNWSSYFISVRPLEIGYLSAAEAHSLLTEPRRGEPFELSYAEGVVEQIIALTRCQPYLVQLVGETLVNEANRRKVRHVSPTMLEATLPLALRNGPPYFDNLWREQVGNTAAEVAAGQAILRALADGQPLPTRDTSAAQAALRRMQRYRIIELVGTSYQIEVPLVARWVRECSELAT